MRCLCNPWLAAALAVALAVAGRAQDAPAPDAPAPDPLASIVAELGAPRTLYGPNEDIRVRFSLLNAGDDVVEIPIGHPPPADAWLLPDELIFGFAGEPRLFLALAGERASPVETRAVPPAQAGDHVIRLAPSAVIGADLNVRALDRLSRYAGSHELTWRPLGREHSVATLRYRVEPRKRVVISTDHGRLFFDLAYDAAPRNVAHFLDLVRQRFYDGLTFHRLVPGFIIQGGAPDGESDAMGPDGRTVVAEFSNTPVRTGTLMMSRRSSDPDSASCQFFIALDRLPELDGEYTVIGQASDEESLGTLSRLEQLPTDGEYRPRRPLVIRFVTLLEVPGPRAAPLEVGP